MGERVRRQDIIGRLAHTKTSLYRQKIKLVERICNALALAEKDTQWQDIELAFNGPSAPVDTNNQLPRDRNPENGVNQNSRNNDNVQDQIDIALDKMKDSLAQNLIIEPSGGFIPIRNTIPDIPEKGNHA